MIATLWLVLSLAGGASSSPWLGRRVVVYDYTSPEWRLLIKTAVNQFNAVLPKSAPRFAYQSMRHKSCRDVRPRRGISVCMDADENFDDPFMTAGTSWELGSRGYSRSLVRIRTSAEPDSRVACHEMAHAILGIGEGWTLVDGRMVFPYPDQSCVWGELTSPGSFDVEYARRKYSRR